MGMHHATSFGSDLIRSSHLGIKPCVSAQYRLGSFPRCFHRKNCIQHTLKQRSSKLSSNVRSSALQLNELVRKLRFAQLKSRTSKFRRIANAALHPNAWTAPSSTCSLVRHVSSTLPLLFNVPNRNAVYLRAQQQPSAAP